MADIIASAEVTILDVMDGIADNLYLAYADNSDGSVGFSFTPKPTSKYIGTYKSKETTQSTDRTRYKWLRQSGADGLPGPKGNDGVPGKDGVGIKSTVITYGLSASDSTQPSTWATTVPNLVKGQYLWTKTVWTYSDNTSETGYVKTYIARDGNNGNDGIAGKDGVGIKSTSITYASSSSGTTAPTSGWSTSMPTVSQGMFLWTKTVWTYTDNTSETGYSVARMGTDGAQGTPGPKGADGKTSYHHWAYSDNADGTGLTLTDNGQRYIGHYSDYIQADSTDKTKYRWADRWAKIEVGGRNLAQKTSSDWSTPYTSFSGSANTCPQLYKVLVDDLAVGDTLKSRIVLKYTNIVTASGQTAQIWLQGDGNVTGWGAGRYPNSTYTPISGSGEMVFEHEFKITADNLKNQFWNLMFRADYIASGSLEWKLAKVAKGTVYTDWSRADEDIQADIDSKADQALTQEQLNALNEQNNLIQANMEALAAAKALTDLEEAYNEYVRANDAAKKVSEGELATLKERTAKHVTKLAKFAEDWEFMTTKLRIAEEGIYFGKLDGSSEIKITDDRISFWSSKKQVMWITAGTLNIDNGIFTVSVQIGRFREEQYTTNPDINVIRYVG